MAKGAVLNRKLFEFLNQNFMVAGFALKVIFNEDGLSGKNADGVHRAAVQAVGLEQIDLGGTLLARAFKFIEGRVFGVVGFENLDRYGVQAFLLIPGQLPAIFQFYNLIGAGFEIFGFEGRQDYEGGDGNQGELQLVVQQSQGGDQGIQVVPPQVLLLGQDKEVPSFRPPPWVR